MTDPERIKQTLLSEIEKMDQHREDFCRCPGIDFTRDRKIPFDTLLHFQISMESGSVNHELLKYFRFDAAALSLSAFYQQRAKLSKNVSIHELTVDSQGRLYIFLDNGEILRMPVTGIIAAL